MAPEKKQQRQRKKSGPKTKTPPKKKEQTKSGEVAKAHKSDYYTVVGDIALTVAQTTLSENKEFVSQELVVDKSGNSFGRGSLTVDRNGVRSLVLLEARQVELVLKTLRVVPYE